MLRTFRMRPAAFLAGAAWLSAAALHGVAPALSALMPEQKTAVEAAAITISAQPPATCHHHPQGCPADCFCPKTFPNSGDEAADGEVSAPLGEPAWAHCSESRSSAAPAFAVYLPQFAPRVFLREDSGPLPATAERRAPEPLPDRPAKIPIA